MSTAKGKIEDLVKSALKEALEKRKLESNEEALAPVVATPTVLAPKEEAPKTTSFTKTLKEGERMFSEVIGRTDVPNNEDFPVTVFDSYVWDEKVAFLIPEVDESYVIDKDLAKDILMAWEIKDKTLVYGPTGSGKSSLLEQLCARTSRPYLRINCTGDMDSSMIFGQLTAKEGTTEWVDGAVTEAVKYGAVFAWDEWDVTPPEISMGLQWLLEDNGKLFLKEMPGNTKDKQIVPHEHFRIVAIGNTQGQGDDTGAHAGTNVQNSATLDRFGTAVYVDYLPPATEEKMILNKWPSVSAKGAKELVKLANLIRQGYKAGQLSLTLSPRSLFGVCKKLSKGNSLRKAFSLTYFNKLSETQRKVAEQLFEKVYGPI